MTEPSYAAVPDAPVSALGHSKGPRLAGFAQFRFTAGEFGHTVYYCGNRHDPPLLLMPELAGFSPGMLQFAERLRQERFQVYVPWLFGPFGQRTPVRNAIRLCISREFANLRAGVSSCNHMASRAGLPHKSTQRRRQSRCDWHVSHGRLCDSLGY
jgi:dienelactone hydrolase